MCVEKHYLADFTTHMFFLSMFLAFALLNIKTNSLTVNEVNSFPNYFYLYILQFVAPSLIAFSIAAVQYVRHYDMRKTIVKESVTYITCIE